MGPRPVPGRRAQSGRLADHRRQSQPQFLWQGHLAGDPVRQDLLPLQPQLHRTVSPPQPAVSLRPDKATQLQDQPAENYVCSYNQVLGSRLLLDGRGGRMWGVNPASIRRKLFPTDISDSGHLEIHDRECLDGAVSEPESPLPGEWLRQPTSSRAARRRVARPQGRRPTLVGGHGLRPDHQRRPIWRSGRRRGAPRQLEQHADQLGSPPTELGGIFQDRWIIGRATINAGVRIDGVSAYLPAQVQPGGNLCWRALFPENRCLRLRPQRDAAPGHCV